MKVPLTSWLFLAFLSTAGVAQTADDYLGHCESESKYCSVDQKEFKKWFPKAMRGDYQGQRNVAFMLSGRGEAGAVIPNKITGCAWRMLIIASGSPKVDSTDTSNLKLDCGRLGDVEREAAAAQAQTLSKRIGRR
jgi:hypothetical protein